MATVRVPIRGTVLRWAMDQARLSDDALAQRLNVKPETVASWEHEDTRPTLNQLRTMGRVLRQNPAVFLLDDPPASASTPRPPEFRASVDSAHDAEVARELERAARRRDVMLELAPDPPQTLERVRWTQDMSPARAAADLREAFGLKYRQSAAAAADALNGWIDLVNAHGVLVFQMSRVSKNRIAGTSVYDQAYPFIILNGASAPNVRIFTLAHELGHLMSHSGGICNVWDDVSTEVRCNEFAAAFLMPTSSFQASLGNDSPLEAIPRLAREFAVSYSAVAVRLRTLGRISQAELDDQLAIAQRLAAQADELEKQRRRRSKGGPPHHRVHLRNLGRQYFDTVAEALDEDRISLLDASYYAEAKLPTFDKMREERAAGKGVDLEVLA